jgi:hypothetical protein
MARSRPTPPLAQHGLRQLRAPGSDSGTRRGGHGHRGATTPTLAVLAVWLPAASPRSTSSSGSDTADAGTHGYQTLTPDTRRRTPGRRTPGRRTPGHRTPDTRTLRRRHRTLDTGRVDIARADAGRRPRTDADRWTKARPASGYPGATTPGGCPAGAPIRVPVDGACGARQPMQARR